MITVPVSELAIRDGLALPLLPMEYATSLMPDNSNFASRIKAVTAFKSLPAKINFFHFSEIHAFLPSFRARCEGRIAIVTKRGAECGGRRCAC